MTQQAHTPGPWYVEQSNSCGTTGLYVDGPEDSICDLYSQPEGAGTKLHPFRNAEANARLIAAAPDLLEALEKSVSMMRSLAGQLENTCGAEDTYFQYSALEKSIRTIIKTARGEA